MRELENIPTMASLLEELVPQEGNYPSILPGVTLMRANTTLPRIRVLQQPSIVMVGQGQKRGYLGGQVYTYDPTRYLVLAVPTPFECETTVKKGNPTLSLSIDIDIVMLGEILLKLGHKIPTTETKHVFGIYATSLSQRMNDATIRLLQCLRNKKDAEILGKQIIREIHYYILRGENATALATLFSVNRQITHVQRALERIHADYRQELSVLDLASDAGMSVSRFHHSFKALTSTSPLQYIKAVRLHKAKTLIAQHGMGVAEAARTVGYESSSQFSREFKRFFGASPTAESSRLRGGTGYGEGADSKS